MLTTAAFHPSLVVLSVSITHPSGSVAYLLVTKQEISQFFFSGVKLYTFQYYSRLPFFPVALLWWYFKRHGDGGNNAMPIRDNAV